MSGARDGALAEAIEGLYRTFGRYPLRSYVEGCDCCTEPEDHALIHARPLRALTPGDLERFAWKAMTTWGDADDFRHFLPRLFELVVWDELRYSSEVVMGKLSHGEWRRWPEPEQAAIEAFFTAWWRAVLSTFPPSTGSWTAETSLCSIAQAADDLAPWLSIWERDTSEAATRHLAQFIKRLADELWQAKPLRVFWRGRVRPGRQAIEWLLGPGIAERLEETFFRAGEPFATELSEALDVLTWAKVVRAGSAGA